LDHEVSLNSQIYHLLQYRGWRLVKITSATLVPMKTLAKLTLLRGMEPQVCIPCWVAR